MLNAVDKTVYALFVRSHMVGPYRHPLFMNTPRCIDISSPWTRPAAMASTETKLPRHQSLTSADARNSLHVHEDTHAYWQLRTLTFSQTDTTSSVLHSIGLSNCLMLIHFLIVSDRMYVKKIQGSMHSTCSPGTHPIHPTETVQQRSAQSAALPYKFICAIALVDNCDPLAILCFNLDRRETNGDTEDLSRGNLQLGG
eukprot:m.406451 g.406451  ORF g.406451 m.406451 type:complete len:198 (+) comp21215_c0_seq4:807-1400(+)